MRALFLVLLVGCGRIGFDSAEQALDATPACAFGRFSMGTQLTILSSPVQDWSPALSPDGTLLLFETLRDGTDNANIYRSPRIGPAMFGSPVIVDALDTGVPDQSPAWSTDGKEVYFDSARNGDFEIYVASFDGSFGPPQEIGLVGSSPVLAPSSLELLFTTNAFPQDLQRATRSAISDAWTVDNSAFENVNTVMFEEGYPSLSSDGLTLYFESNRNADGRIFVTTRDTLDAAFATPTMVDEFNAGGVDYGDPDISPDGTLLLYTSSETGDFEIFESTRVCL